jgi:hypothetical protein
MKGPSRDWLVVTARIFSKADPRILMDYLVIESQRREIPLPQIELRRIATRVLVEEEAAKVRSLPFDQVIARLRFTNSTYENALSDAELVWFARKAYISRLKHLLEDLSVDEVQKFVDGAARSGWHFSHSDITTFLKVIGHG